MSLYPIPPGIDINSVDRDTICRLKDKIKGQMTKWLFGLDDPAEILARAIFMLMPYTDKITRTKILGQPHIMFEGGTGIGKTDLVQSMAMSIDAKSTRIQGTPDLMPYHITGYSKPVRTEDGLVIRFEPGKIFSHIVFIDEGNRLRPQTKSAILEAMEERSVTPSVEFIDPEGKNIMEAIPMFPLSKNYKDINSARFFMVLSTQNIFGEESGEGSNENPMAELDRITISVHIKRPSLEEEIKISADNVVGKSIEKVTDLNEILSCAHFIFENIRPTPQANWYRAMVLRNSDPATVEGDRAFEGFIKENVAKFIQDNVAVGGTPRVNFHLEAAARVEAFFDGCDQIRPEHVKKVAKDVMKHRLALRAESINLSDRPHEAKEIIIDKIINNTRMPKWTPQ